jgi:alanyl-tRNA synthetase
LRFDFSHFSKVSDEELRQVEASVNAQIEAQLQLRTVIFNSETLDKALWLCLVKNMVIQFE